MKGLEGIIRKKDRRRKEGGRSMSKLVIAAFEIVV